MVWLYPFREFIFSLENFLSYLLMTQKTILNQKFLKKKIYLKFKNFECCYYYAIYYFNFQNWMFFAVEFLFQKLTILKKVCFFYGFFFSLTIYPFFVKHFLFSYFIFCQELVAFLRFSFLFFLQQNEKAHKFN